MIIYVPLLVLWIDKYFLKNLNIDSNLTSFT